MKNKILILIAVLFSFSATAQKNVTLAIKHMLGTSPFAFNQATTNNLSNNLEFTRVDYYISNVTLIHDGGMQTAVPKKYLFVQGGNNHVEGLGQFNITNVEGVKFHVGVDAPNNTSDPSQWSGSHPLAPKSPSMHWGWASGFRFAAIEGNGGTSLGNLFEFHGLFDANYFEQTIMVSGVNSGNEVVINLDADYTQAVKDIDVSAGVINHGDNTNDLTVLKNFRDDVFSAGTGVPLAIRNLENEIDLKIYPNPSTGNVRISLDNTSKAMITSAQIVDVSGRLIKELALVNENQVDVQLTTKGIYFVKLNSYGIQVATRKIVVQ